MRNCFDAQLVQFPPLFGTAVCEQALAIVGSLDRSLPCATLSPILFPASLLVSMYAFDAQLLAGLPILPQTHLAATTTAPSRRFGEKAMNRTIVDNASGCDDRWIVTMFVVGASALQLNMSRQTRASGVCDRINAAWFVWMSGVLAVLHSRVNAETRSFLISLPSCVTLTATRLSRAREFKTASPDKSMEWLGLWDGNRGHAKAFGCLLSGFLLSYMSAHSFNSIVSFVCIWVPELSRLATVASAYFRARTDITHLERARILAVSQVSYGHLAFHLGLGTSDMFHAFCETGKPDIARLFSRMDIGLNYIL